MGLVHHLYQLWRERRGRGEGRGRGKREERKGGGEREREERGEEGGRGGGKGRERRGRGRGEGEGRERRGRGDAKPENMDPTDTNTSFPATYMSLGSLVALVVLVEIGSQAVPSALAFHLPLEHQQLLVARPYRCCQVDQCLLGFHRCRCGQGVPWVPASLLYPSSQAFQESPVRKG